LRIREEWLEHRCFSLFLENKNLNCTSKDTLSNKEIFF